MRSWGGCSTDVSVGCITHLHVLYRCGSPHESWVQPVGTTRVAVRGRQCKAKNEREVASPSGEVRASTTLLEATAVSGHRRCGAARSSRTSNSRMQQSRPEYPDFTKASERASNWRSACIATSV